MNDEDREANSGATIEEFLQLDEKAIYEKVLHMLEYIADKIRYLAERKFVET